MFNTVALLEYLISPESINKIIVAILMFGVINPICIIYNSIRSTYGITKKQRETKNSTS